MTKNSVLKLEILNIISKKGVAQRDDFPKKLNTDLANIDRCMRDLIEYDIVNLIRGCGYVITEDTTAFDVLSVIEDTSVMVEDNNYRLDDNNLSTMLRGYSKLHEELKTIVFKGTTIKQIISSEAVRHKRSKQRALKLF